MFAFLSLGKVTRRRREPFNMFTKTSDLLEKGGSIRRGDDFASPEEKEPRSRDDWSRWSYNWEGTCHIRGERSKMSSNYHDEAGPPLILVD